MFTLPRWVTRLARMSLRPDHPSANRPRGARPGLEVLEDRATPATLYWTGGGSNPNFSNAGNWSRHLTPKAGDTVVFGAARAGEFTATNNLRNLRLGSIVVREGSTVTLAGQNVRADRVVLTGGSINTGSGTLFASDIRTYASVRPASISGGLNLAGGLRRIHVDDGGAWDDLVISANIHNGGLYKTGTGNLVLSGTNDYTGYSVVVAGALEARSNTALGGNEYRTEVHPGGRLVLGSGITLEEPLRLWGDGDGMGALQATGNGSIVNANVELMDSVSVGGGDSRIQFDGAISGPGRLVQVGDLLITLNAANTYRGGTLVAHGILQLSNPLGVTTAHQITVANGAVLSGSGTVGSVTVEAGGRLVPHGLRTEDLLFQPGGILDVDYSYMDQVAPGDSLLDVFGTVTLNGAILRTPPVLRNVQRSYTLIANHGGEAIDGAFEGRPQDVPFGEIGSYTLDPSGGITLTSYRLRTSYVAGSGHDVVLNSNAPPVIMPGSHFSSEVTLEDDGGNVIYYSRTDSYPLFDATDADDTLMVGATVIIIGIDPEHDSISYPEVTGLGWDFNPDTGVLTVDGPASLATYVSAFRELSFTTTNNAYRTYVITFTFNDGKDDGSATTSFSIDELVD